MKHILMNILAIVALTIFVILTVDTVVISFHYGVGLHVSAAACFLYAAIISVWVYRGLIDRKYNRFVLHVKNNMYAGYWIYDKILGLISAVFYAAGISLVLYILGKYAVLAMGL